MSEMIRKTLENKLTAEPGERAVVARISTADVDRDGDVVLPSGILFDEYMKNPVVLMQHRADMPPVGRAMDIQTTSRHVKAKIVFPERPMWMAQQDGWAPDVAFALYQKQLLNAFSIGFAIEDARPASQKDMDRFGDGARRIISRWKLLEFSAVSVPANQNALAVAVSKSATWLRELWQPQTPARRIVLPPPRVVRLDPRTVEIG
jgi:hypothetical protein